MFAVTTPKLAVVESKVTNDPVDMIPKSTAIPPTTSIEAEVTLATVLTRHMAKCVNLSESKLLLLKALCSLSNCSDSW